MADVENNNEKSQLKGADSAASAAAESADNFRSEIWSDQMSRANAASDQTGRANAPSDQTGRTNPDFEDAVRTKTGENNGKGLATGDANASNTARGDAYASNTARGDAYASNTARGDAYASNTARGDAYASNTARGDAYPSNTARGDAYPSNTARGDAYPSNTARGDAYPSNTARGDASPMPTLTIDNPKEGKDPTGGKSDKEVVDKISEEKEPSDKKREQYDPFFQNENMLQSMMQPLDAPQGGDRTEVVGNDSYRFDENGYETYQNNQGRVVTNPDGTFTVEGNVASWTQSKDGYDQTIVFNDGSRVYLAGGRIRAVSSERENGKTPYSRYREIHRSYYK